VLESSVLIHVVRINDGNSEEKRANVVTE